VTARDATRRVGDRDRERRAALSHA